MGKTRPAANQQSVDYHTFYKHGLKLLKQTPVMEVKDFETAIKAQFDSLPADALENMTRDGKPIKRTKWENLCDWVKANLTKQGQITYLKFAGKKLIIYCPVLGYLTLEGQSRIALTDRALLPEIVGSLQQWLDRIR